MKSILRKTSGTFGMIAALTLAAGCAQNGPTDQVPEQAQNSEQLNAKPRAKSETAKKSRGDRKGFARRGGGPEMLFRAALDKLELRADQKTTIEGLIADMKKIERPANDSARKELDKSLAAAVRAGKVDPASFDTQLAALDKTKAGHASEVHAALNKLHETLDATQRANLVAELKKKMEAGPGMRGPHRGMMRGMHGMRGGPGGMGRMRGLDLTEDQQAKLRESMKAQRPDFQSKGPEMRELHTKMLNAFASDSFNANKLMDPSEVQNRSRDHAKMRIEHLAKLTAILTPEQREKLATQLEAGPRKMMQRQ